MELKEFKKIWNQELEKENSTTINTSEILNAILMNANSLMGKLNSTTLYWWKLARNTFTLLILVLLLNIGMFFLFPHKFQNLQNALPVYSTIGVFALSTLWIYYEKAKIFEVYDSNNLKQSIENVLKRFNRWYTLSTLFYIVVFPPVFYVIIKITLQSFHATLPFKTEIGYSLLLSIVSLIGNHLYYKRTYFKWLDNLKINLQELSEESVS
jgi:hypothetical protein